MDDSLSQTDEIATLLHEIGHALSDLFDTPDADIKAINNAYGMIYTQEKVSDKNMSIVLATEQRAWDNGRELAKRLKIKLGKWYSDVEKACLKEYKEV